MSSLPSFVELMASLGLGQSTSALQVPRSTTASPRLESVHPSSPTRSKSSPSLRESPSRHRVARYSPYSPSITSNRRGSISSISSSSSDDLSPSSNTFPTSTLSSLRARRSRNKLFISIYGSTSDFAADTPISTYVRRKTPGLSPASPTFPASDLPITPPMPLTLPILPSLLPNSASSDSFPVTPTSDCELPLSRPCSPVGEPNSLTEGPKYIRQMRRHTGVRISTHLVPQTSTSDIFVTVPTFDQV
ncbi:hypothetical protein K443DRAFT_672427 [Laccaria amethystina LaAM-08-1]|uniref:Uncharacterized protein n=1 Tax=Laccaria amethystina LaAM-08-1 TaxID=1095629 RepID=A0A0C9Y3G0_9AGAR|nr:hypothetical protein K443DRAFT_672427 [Laccaria amethystina LaAM-08-1]